MKQKLIGEIEAQKSTISEDMAIKKCHQWAIEDGIPPEEIDDYIKDCLKYFSEEDY